MKPFFKNESLQQQYNQDGYVVVDLLNESEVKELKDYYDTLNNDHIPSYGFHVSLDNNNTDFVSGVMNKIESVVSGPADNVFSDYKIFTTSYVVKEKNPVSIVPPHQDWNFTVEEEGYSSATVWVALVETDMYNGAMGVIVGSHKFFNHRRPSPSPQSKSPLDVHVFSIFPYLKLIPMKPGQALIFDNRTVHASPPNVSEGVRLAAGFGVTQKDAPLRHYYMQPENEGKVLDVYEANDYFFTHYNNAKLSALYNEGKRPEGLQLVGTVEHEIASFTADEMVAKIKAAGNTFNIEMCEHMAKLFSYNMDGTKKEEPKEVVKPETPEVVKEEAIEAPVTETAPVAESPLVNDKPEKVTDNRGFFQKYTPLNILREVQHRVFEK